MTNCVQVKPARNILKLTRVAEIDLHSGGKEGVDTCTGDGGSPLMCPVNRFSKHMYQAGIVSDGYRCGEKDTPGLYVKVTHFRKWIDDKLKELDLSIKHLTYGSEWDED
jgi:secreted trypsin-like serine protease